MTVFSKEERLAMIDTDSEFKRKGFFRRIFPCVDFLYYKQFFEEDRPLNYLIDAKIFSKKRGTNQASLRKHQPLPLFMMQNALVNEQLEKDTDDDDNINSRQNKK
jgi:hypothetical protein